MAFSVRSMFGAGKHRPWVIAGCILFLAGVIMIVMGLLPRQVAESPVATSSAGATAGASAADQQETQEKSISEMPDPRGLPISMVITQPGLEDITMNFAPRVKNGDLFDSQSGKVAWWDELDWPTPGTLSMQKSLVTGHMRHGNTYYPIARLSEVRAGAVLTVNYDSGDVMVASATGDAVLIDKDLTNRDEGNLQNQTPARIIRVTTCDPTNGVDKDGHALQNSVVFFERTK